MTFDPVAQLSKALDAGRALLAPTEPGAGHRADDHLALLAALARELAALAADAGRSDSRYAALVCRQADTMIFAIAEHVLLIRAALYPDTQREAAAALHLLRQASASSAALGAGT